MDIPLIFLGLAMMGIGTLIALVQIKALKDGKHTTGDFIVRLLITGIIGIILGLMIIIKSI